MISDVKAALNNLAGAAVPLSNAAGLGRIFELYVMTGIASQLLALGWSTKLLRSDGMPLGSTDSFIQRGGKPGGVASAAKGKNGPSSIEITSPKSKVWEVWNGVQFRGRSNALHEFDIAIVPKEIANDLRASSTIDVPFGRPVVAIECKDVQSAGSPDEMRTLVARIYDVTILEGHKYLTSNKQVNAIYSDYSGGICTTGYIDARKSYFSSNRKNKSVLARTGAFSAGASAMTAYYRIAPYANVVPGHPSAALLFSDIGNWIDSNL